MKERLHSYINLTFLKGVPQKKKKITGFYIGKINFYNKQGILILSERNKF